MKTKERLVLPGALTGEHTQLLSPLPEFDIQKAARARIFVDNLYGTEFSGFRALRVALVLSLYNLDIAKEGATDNDLVNHLIRLSPMVEEELRASELDNPLPTIVLR